MVYFQIKNPPAGCQAQLNLLAKKPSFREIPQEELGTRNPRERDADPCIAVAYHEGSKYAHGNTKAITIDRRNHRTTEAATVVAFLRFQQSWGDQPVVTWREKPKGTDWA